MYSKLIPSFLSAMALAFVAAADAASGPVTIEFYTGAYPASPAVATSGQTKLGTLTCSDPVATESAGVISFRAITQDNAADADGTAAWARFKDGAGVAFWDVDVTSAAGSGVIKLNTTAIVAGGPIAMSSLTITLGG